MTVSALVHCTAPRWVGGKRLDYSLMRHHESGKGVSTCVIFPENEPVTLARIGNDLKDMLICSGDTAGFPNLPSCRSQLSVRIPSSENLIRNLLGTHLICGFGVTARELAYCADFLGLRTRLVKAV